MKTRAGFEPDEGTVMVPWLDARFCEETEAEQEGIDQE